MSELGQFAQLSYMLSKMKDKPENSMKNQSLLKHLESYYSKNKEFASVLLPNTK